MTKDELLVLLGSLDSIEAGAAAWFVESLESNDPRFQRPFLGKPLSTLGCWLEQKKVASGGELLGLSLGDEYCTSKYGMPSVMSTLSWSTCFRRKLIAGEGGPFTLHFPSHACLPCIDPPPAYIYTPQHLIRYDRKLATEGP